jgi:hypothetical protein
MTVSVAVRRSLAVSVVGLLASLPAFAEDRTVSFETSSRGAFLTAPSGGGSDLFANKYEPKDWETFRLIDLDGGKLLNYDRVCLRTFNGHFVVAENGGGREVKANRRQCQAWETFRIVMASGPGGYPVAGGAEIPFFHGFAGVLTVGLQASDGSWVTAEGGGGSYVNANRPAFGPWERFRVFYH